MKTPIVTLEQWLVLVTIVETGSFARAAEALSKSQSAISYAVHNMNQQLPQPILINQGRKAVLTDNGQVLYRRARRLLSHALEIEQIAHSLAQGMESRLTVAVDAIVPVEQVLQAVAAFGRQTPQTRVVLLETTLSGTSEALLERKADLVLTGQVPPGFLAQPLTQVQMIPVAHVQHPLAQASEPLTEQDLMQSRQIVVRDSGRHDQDQGWLGSEQRFTVSHFATSLKALQAGLGFAFVPEAQVAPLIQQGELVRLKLSSLAQRTIPVYLIHSARNFVGPACEKFVEELTRCFMSTEPPPPASDG